MAKKRIIKNNDNKFAVQVYDKNIGWDFIEYCETINMLGSEVECVPYPKWYNTYDEVLCKINKCDTLIDECIEYEE